MLRANHVQLTVLLCVAVAVGHLAFTLRGLDTRLETHVENVLREELRKYMDKSKPLHAEITCHVNGHPVTLHVDTPYTQGDTEAQWRAKHKQNIRDMIADICDVKQ